MVEKFIDIRRRGYYVDSGQLTSVYNRVLNKSVRPTNCGTCLSQRVKELEAALNRYKAKLAKEELKKQEETNNGKGEQELSGDTPSKPKTARQKRKSSKT